MSVSRELLISQWSVDWQYKHLLITISRSSLDGIRLELLLTARSFGRAPLTRERMHHSCARGPHS